MLRKIFTLFTLFLLFAVALQSLMAQESTEYGTEPDPYAPTWEQIIYPRGAGFDYTGLGTGLWVRIHTQRTVHCSTDWANVVYTRTSQGTNWATWRPNLPANGQYDIYAYIPNYDSFSPVTQQARYSIRNGNVEVGSVTLNQQHNKCQWVHLGRYSFNAGTNAHVYIGVGTNESPFHLVAADAVKFVQVPNIVDNILPTVRMTAPTNGTTISSPSVTIKANASDTGGSGLNRVEFFASYNNQIISLGTDSSAPFETTWNIPSNVGSGQILLSVKAFDNSGNSSTNSSHSYAYINYQKPQQPCGVPYFSQIDSRWRNHPLRTGGAGTCSSSCNTIGRCGCTLTSTAMLFAFYGHGTNPQQLSDCMGGNACPFVWGTAGSNCSGGKAQIARVSGFSWTALSQELNQHNKPVIVGGKTRRGTTHWVLVTSGSGNHAQNYTVHDPGVLNGRNVKLSDALSSFTSIRTYHGGSLCSADLMDTSDAFVMPGYADLMTTNSEDGLQVIDPWIIQSTSTVTAEVVPYRNEGDSSIILIDIASEQSQIVEMLVWSDTYPQGSWQEFHPIVSLPLSDEVFVRLREVDGSVTETIPILTTPVTGPSEVYNILLPLVVR